MLILALLNRQLQPGRRMSLVVSRQREAEIPLALMMHPHSVWPAISDVVDPQRAHASAVREAWEFFTACACMCCDYVQRMTVAHKGM